MEEKETSNGNGEQQPTELAPSKRPKLTEYTINQVITDKLPKLKQAWMDGTNLDDTESVAEMSTNPFQHCELQDFITETTELLDPFIETAYNSGQVEFIEKSTDLYQFKQSLDLASIELPGLDKLTTFFNGPVYEFVKELTGLPLNGQVDMFLSDYQQTDHLLCHDDELESRRIAFILYFNKDWKQEFGGTLDLFGSVDFPLAPKTTVQTSIIPAYNKFVFFDVSCRSFHQVSEVLQPGVRRLALSGWFLGDPLSRPDQVNVCHKIYKPLGSMEDTGHVNETYLDEAIQKSINEQLESDSEVMLIDFLTSSHYANVLKELGSIKWIEKGPPNTECCFETEVDSSKTLQAVVESKEFHNLLEKLTEFEFGLPSTLCTSNLSKFGHKCYQLIKKDTHNESSDDDNDADEEEEEEGHLIDVLYFAGTFAAWEESYGGEIIYVDGNGDQLITITPHPNSLAIVVRTPSVSSYVRYINCTANELFYYCFKATYKFDNQID